MTIQQAELRIAHTTDCLTDCLKVSQLMGTPNITPPYD
jgi:hypothetical protein